LPGANVGALVGVIGRGQPFLIGSGGTFVADSTGTLQITVNDTDFFSADDIGEFGVVVSVEPIGDLVYLPGTLDGWLPTGVEFAEGENLTIEAGGTLNLWPRCEQEKDGAGLSDIDCELMSMSPSGTNAIDLASPDHPLPGARVGALIGRFGEDGAPFLIGAGGTFPVDQSGELSLRINDNFGMGDNEGGFTVIIRADDLP
jgi:hypothetical protein